MNRRLLLLLLLFWLSACNAPRVQDSYSLPTLTPLPSRTPDPSQVAVPGGAEGVGLAFFRAWEGGDYLGMYSLLAPQSQTLVDSQAFISRYREAMTTAAVRGIHVQPLSAIQEGDRARLEVRLVWDSAVVGDIISNLNVELLYRGDRWGIVWHEGLILPELAGGNRLRLDYRIPARANIYDVNGSALAFQGTAINLGVIPGQIVDEAGLLAAVGSLLGRSPEALKARYASAQADWYVPLGDISSETMQANYNLLQPYIGRGLSTSNRLTRLYPTGSIAPHIVGYTGEITAEEMDAYRAQGYRGDEKTVGRAGIEAWGERYLRGTYGGTLTVVGANGEYVTTLAEVESRQARSIFLTLDREFQAAVAQALADAITSHPQGHVGAIVVLNPQTGAVLAMASYPAYDPVVFDPTYPNRDAELARLLNDPARPLLNRAAQGGYPAGSTFKVVTFAAGLNSGLFTPQSRYTSTGTWNRLGDQFIKRDWRAGGHGTVSLAQALVVSCNSCFYEVGYQIDGVDQFLLPNTARQFGFGAPTGIQGVAESGGLIPDPDWKLATVGEGWATGDTVNMAIGQGYVLATPLQMANMMAGVANGGTLPRPRLIDRIGAGGGAPEEPWPNESLGQLPLLPEQLAVVQESLRAVTSSGSGTATDRFQTLNVPVAGKTGTAESTPGAEPHAWFAGYAPAAPYTLPNGRTIDRPELAIAVLVENAGEGSAVAAPIFRRVVELYYGITPLTPYPWEGRTP